MKEILVMAFLSVLIACKKDKTPLPHPETFLKGGSWNLTKSKRGNEAWKDSIGLFYRFQDDTTVITNRFTPGCNGKYEAYYSSGLRTILTSFWSCKPSANFGFSLESIEGDKMTIFYPEEIGGQIIQFKEQYVRQ